MCKKLKSGRYGKGFVVSSSLLTSGLKSGRCVRTCRYVANAIFLLFSVDYVDHVMVTLAQSVLFRRLFQAFHEVFGLGRSKFLGSALQLF